MQLYARRCEACTVCSDVGCDDCGLPSEGASECVAQCEPKSSHVLCDGQDEQDFCNCGDDCTWGDFCECDEAKAADGCNEP